MNTKKAYIQPVLSVLTIATQQMIAASATMTLGVGTGTMSATESLSPGGNFLWDDEIDY